MKQLALVLALVCITTVTLAQSQVSGTAQLADASNAQGIEVVFLATTTSAQTDTTYTDSTGAYDITLANGRYDVYFNLEGYHTQVLEEQLIAENTVLNSVELQAIQIDWVDLDGILPDGMTLAKGVPYRIQNAIQIPYGQTLTVEPGVVLTFSEGATMHISAEVSFPGTESDPILFLGENGATWSNLRIEGFDGERFYYIKFEHCIFKDVEQIDLSISGPEFTHCTFLQTSILFTNTLGGGGVPLIMDHCKVFGPKGVEAQGQFMYVELYDTEFYNTEPWVEGGDSYALKGVYIQKTVHYNTFSGYNMALDTYLFGGAILERNLFLNNETALAIHNWHNQEQYSAVQNNLFRNNSLGVQHDLSYKGNFNSNIFLENTYDFLLPEAAETTLTIEYNLFSDADSIFNVESSANMALDLVGAPLLTDNRGIPSDTYYNIYGDPGLNFGVKGYLTEGLTSLESILVDRGARDRQDPDGSPLDIGPFHYENQVPFAVVIVPLEEDIIPKETTELDFAWFTTTDQDDYHDGEAIQYYLHLQYANTTVTLVANSDTAYQLPLPSGIPTHTEVTWWVTATDGYGHSEASNTDSFNLENAAPGSFDILSPSDQDTVYREEEVVITWSQATDSDPVTYSVYLSSSETNTTETTTDTTFNFGHLPVGEYTVLVEATDGELVTASSERTFTSECLR